MLIEITNKCNEMCKHCFNSSAPDEPHMTRAVFESIIDFMAINKIYTIHISGGEPFLHPELKQFLRYAYDAYKKRKSKLNIIITTNGTWCLNEEERKKALEIISKKYVSKVFVNTNKKYYKHYDDVVKYFEENEVPKLELDKNWQGVQTNIVKLGRATRLRPKNVSQHANCWDIVNEFNNYPEKKFAEIVNYRDIIKGKVCYPGFGVNGDFRIGPSRFCNALCNISSMPHKLSDAIRNFNPISCNKCKLANKGNGFIDLSELKERMSNPIIMPEMPKIRRITKPSFEGKGNGSLINVVLSKALETAIREEKFVRMRAEVYKYMAMVSYMHVYETYEKYFPEVLDVSDSVNYKIVFDPQIKSIERKKRLFLASVQKSDSTFSVQEVYEDVIDYIKKNTNFFDIVNNIFSYYEKMFMKHNVSNDKLALYVMYMNVFVDRANIYFKNCDYSKDVSGYGAIYMESICDEIMYMANHTPNRVDPKDQEAFEEYLQTQIDSNSSLLENEDTKPLMSLIDDYDQCLMDGICEALLFYGYAQKN